MDLDLEISQIMDFVSEEELIVIEFFLIKIILKIVQ